MPLPYRRSPNAAWIPISAASPRNRRSIGQIGPNGFGSPGNRKTWGKETASYLFWRAEWGTSNAIKLELEDEVGDRELGGGLERGGREVRQG